MNIDKIGNLIKQIRIENNLTQAQLADKLHVTYQAVSKWENGKSIPDVATLKEISRVFNVKVDDLLEGKKSLPRKGWLIVLGIASALIILLLITLIILHLNSEVGIKKLTSSCSDFTLIGSAAYNKDKGYIYISNIDYCGNEDDTKYERIDCKLYELYNDTNRVISSCTKNQEKTTLEEYLKDVTISVDNYSSSCKRFVSTNLYLELNAYREDGKITTYKIPIDLNDNC